MYNKYEITEYNRIQTGIMTVVMLSMIAVSHVVSIKSISTPFMFAKVKRNLYKQT